MEDYYYVVRKIFENLGDAIFINICSCILYFQLYSLPLVCDLSFWNILNDSFIWRFTDCVPMLKRDFLFLILDRCMYHCPPDVYKHIGKIGSVICFLLQ